MVMVDDNLELEEGSFKFLWKLCNKISSNCRQKYSVIRHKGFPISSCAQGSEGWGKVSNMDKLSTKAILGKLRAG